MIDFPILGTLGGIAMLVAGLVGYLIKRFFDDRDRRLTEIEDENKERDKRLNTLELKAGVIEKLFSRIEKKLDDFEEENK